MELTIEQILNINAAATKILNLNPKFKVQYPLLKFVKITEHDIKIFNDSRISTLKRLGTVNDTDNKYDISDENMEEWTKEYLELINHKVKLENVILIRQDILDDTKIPSSLLNDIYLLIE